MSIRRILVEKSVRPLGKWDVNKINDDIVRLIDIDSVDKKGSKLRLQLTTQGVQVARTMFQEAQPDDFIPLSTVLNITVGVHSPSKIMCFTRGTKTAYSVIVYQCDNGYDPVEFVDNFRRLRKGVTVDGDSFDLRPMDDGNWTLIRANNPHLQGTLYVQNSRRTTSGQNKVIVVPPHPHESGTLSNANHVESQGKVPVQNGSSVTQSDSGIVTNGTGTSLSSTKSRSKPKRAKSFKLFDSLKGHSKREHSPKRERKMKHEKFEKRETKSFENNKNEVNVSNGVEIVRANDNISKTLQDVNERIRNIELRLEKGQNGEEVSETESPIQSKRHHHHSASDTEVTRVSSKERQMSKSNNNNRIPGVHRNGEVTVAPVEYRVPVGYVVQRPVRVSHVPQTDGTTHHHSHRVRAHSSSAEPSHGVDVRLVPAPNVSSSMTLPRNYSHGSPGTKHTPRVTFDETATEGPSRRNSARSVGRFMNHGPRATDTVVKPIEKVYANHNVYYGQPRAVVIGPGHRQSSSSVRYSSHDRDYIHEDRRNGIPENGL